MSNILLLFKVKMLVAEGLILGKMLSKLVAKLLAHLFRYKRNVGELLCFAVLLIEFHFKAHVNFYLAL